MVSRILASYRLHSTQSLSENGQECHEEKAAACGESPGSEVHEVILLAKVVASDVCSVTILLVLLLLPLLWSRL